MASRAHPSRFSVFHVQGRAQNRGTGSLLAMVCAASLLTAGPALAAEPPDVVASIKPIHSLVAAVMGEVGSPHLIVKGAASPHAASLKPSDAAALQAADVVVWVGPDLEHFLEGAIETLGDDAVTLTLEDVDGLTLLRPRVGGAFDAHDHHHDHDGDHDHDHEAHDHEAHEHEAHDHEAHDHEAHDHEAHDHEAHDHEAHDHEAHEHDEAHAIDPHLWLDPANARVMVQAIADTLAQVDPDHAATYQANAAATEHRLNDVIADLRDELAPVRDTPFIVFHDAYQYFEHRFGMHAAGSVTVRPDTSPGVARLKQIKDRIDQTGAACVFAEPQFEPSLVRVIVEGTQARTGTLDPLGAGLPNGPDLYETLLRHLASSLKMCLEQ